MRHKFSMGHWSELSEGQSRTCTIFLHRHAVVRCAQCGNKQDNAITDLQVTHAMGTNTLPHHHTSALELCTCNKMDDPFPHSWRTQRPWLQKTTWYRDSSLTHLRWAWAQRSQLHFWMLLIWLVFCKVVLTCICRFSNEQFLLTIVF